MDNTDIIGMLHIPVSRSDALRLVRRHGITASDEEENAIITMFAEEVLPDIISETECIFWETAMNRIDECRQQDG